MPMMNLRLLLLAILGAVLVCAFPPRLVGQEVRPGPVAQEPMLEETWSAAYGELPCTRPAYAPFNAADRWWSARVECTGAATWDPTDRGRRKRFPLKGTLIGAAVGAGVAMAFMTVICESGCFSHPDTRKILGGGIGVGALFGFAADLSWYEEQATRGKAPEADPDQ
jgi:hypothetical protein